LLAIAGIIQQTAAGHVSHRELISRVDGKP
jgi:hypothetical protein